MEFNNLFLQTVTNCPGCWWKIFGMFLAALLLGLLLGALLWRKYKSMVNKVEAERDNYHAKLTDTEKDFASLKYKFDESSKENAKLKSSLNKCEADKAMLDFRLNKLTDGGDAGPVSASAGIVSGTGTSGDEGFGYGAIFSSDNLQIIEGIGPKIEQLLKDAGIGTWAALAGASYDKVKGVLDAAGPRYRMHDPKSWSEQAKLAADGKWEELINYQKFLDGGKEGGSSTENPSKVEKLYFKALGFASQNPTDLKLVEGIGPKIEDLLKAAGINNWSDLAAASVAKIQGILDAGGDKFRLASPETWPKQAGLASEGKWSELKEYQEFLDGGKDPG
ncbi:MAG: hypothetical protein KDC34_08055 [Saprospiraceae bacterium]|nr:hypothetical protein [Saprospiraceae bacterium]